MREPLHLLRLIHSDVAGPFPHMSMIQAKYAFTFIDDFSRYCWVYFEVIVGFMHWVYCLVSRYDFEVFGLFKVFKALVENQYERKIKVLRSEKWW